MPSSAETRSDAEFCKCLEGQKQRDKEIEGRLQQEIIQVEFKITGAEGR